MDTTINGDVKIKKAKIKLNRDRPFFSYILLNMIQTRDDNMYPPTMSVTRFGDLYYVEEFVMGLTNAELEGVLAHEAMHMATLTFARRKNRDHFLWNIATDLVINYILKQEGFTLPANGAIPDNNGDFKIKDEHNKEQIIKIAGRTAEEVYDDLYKYAKKIKLDFSIGGDAENNNGSYKGQFDVHIETDEKSKDATEEDLKASDETWKKKTAEAIMNAKNRGNLSANIAREFDGILNPKIDWRKKLVQYVTKDIPVDFTMRIPSKKFYSTGIYYPTTLKENLEVICGVDLSGSIGNEELGEFYSELLGICLGYNQIKLRIVGWDTAVNPKDDIVIDQSNRYSLPQIKLHGGGGTTLSSYTDYIDKMNYRSNIHIIMTDGYIEENPRLPRGNILFVISRGGSDSIVKNCGEVCKLSDIE